MNTLTHSHTHAHSLTYTHAHSFTHSHSLPSPFSAPPQHQHTDDHTITTIQQYLQLQDAQILLVALEFFYQLTLHTDLAVRVSALHGFVPSIVGFVSFTPDRWRDVGESNSRICCTSPSNSVRFAVCLLGGGQQLM